MFKTVNSYISMFSSGDPKVRTTYRSACFVYLSKTITYALSISKIISIPMRGSLLKRFTCSVSLPSPSFTGDKKGVWNESVYIPLLFPVGSERSDSFHLQFFCLRFTRNCLGFSTESPTSLETFSLGQNGTVDHPTQIGAMFWEIGNGTV